MREWQGSIPSAGVPPWARDETKACNCLRRIRSLQSLLIRVIFWEMLPGVGGLVHRDRVFALDDESVEILAQQNGDSLRHGTHNAILDPVELVENGQRAVLKDRISI
jgi:hypothetical protein